MFFTRQKNGGLQLVEAEAFRMWSANCLKNP